MHAEHINIQDALFYALEALKLQDSSVYVDAVEAKAKLSYLEPKRHLISFALLTIR